MKHCYSKEKYVVLPPVTKKSYVIMSDHHLFYTYQLSRIRHQSPGLPYGSPYLPDKIIFWSLLCLSLRFSPFLAQNLGFLIRCMVSGAFLHPSSHWQRLCLPSGLQILIVCTSCKTSYVLSHSHICPGWGSLNFGRGGGVVKKRESPDSRSPEVGISAICS